MKDVARRIQIVRLHKKWADGYTLLWQVFVLGLFGMIYFMLDQFEITPSERNSSFILLAVIIVVATIWQVAGLAVARIHMLLDGIDLRPDERSKNGVDVAKK